MLPTERCDLVGVKHEEFHDAADVQWCRQWGGGGKEGSTQGVTPG